MLVHLLPHRQSWLQEYCDRFLTRLAARRYAHGTLRYIARLLLAFGYFAEQHGTRAVVLLPQWVDLFIATMRGGKKYLRQRRSVLTRFLQFLRQEKVIPLAPDPPPSLGDAVVEDYLRSLREQRGLSPGSVQLHRLFCRSLMSFLAAEGVDDLRAVCPDHLLRFIAQEGKRCRRCTLRSRCSMLRGFLSFLHRRGVVSGDLAGAVLSPRVYKHEQCPRFLTRSEIEGVLATVDRRNPVGRRDYAMLLLLATYGLRGIEVVHLRLDDVDWRQGLLHVRRRKAGNSTTYPLSVAVGEAILAYLRTARPTSPHREVFLTMHAPFTPLAAGSLRTRVKEYLKLAGVRVARPGTHSFRYSCAQRLFEQEMPLKAIGDFLGHRDPNSTQRYTKIALDQLREVANSDGESLL